MTSWSPMLPEKSGPLYTAIADQLARDLESGRLKPGDRLPTHRDLAWKLGVTVGTVTRAYAEAERRGLIAGEVGRGTYIRDRSIDSAQLPQERELQSNFIDLARNVPVEGIADAAIARVIGEVSTSRDIGRLLSYSS